MNRGFKNFAVVGLLLVFIAICFAPCLKNDFVNWDDPYYLLDNSLITDLSFPNIARIFRSVVNHNYQPVTFLSYALEYRFFALNSGIYHLDNLLLHLVNTILVGWLVLWLTRKRNVAVIAALLFAIHPLRVESVAWVTERKDVLFALFYLWGLISYLFYLKDSRFFRRHYFAAFFLFLLSLFAKPAAVTFPLILFLLDFWAARKFSLRVVLEKTPFLLLSLIFGVITVFAANINTLADAGNNLSYVFTWQERVFVVPAALLMYLYKIIWPLNLSCLYPYPPRTGGSLPVLFYLAPLFLLLVLAFVWRKIRGDKNFIFAALFFAVTIIFNLPVMAIGHAIIADRFTYLPSIGLSMLAAQGVVSFWEKQPFRPRWRRFIFWPMGIIYILFLSFLTWNQCKIWKNGLTLWTQAIEKNNKIALAYASRGDYYAFKLKNIDLALKDYNQAIELMPSYSAAYNNRASMYLLKGDYPSAITDYSTAVSLEPYFAGAYLNRALCYRRLGQLDQAHADYAKALRIEPQNSFARRMFKETQTPGKAFGKF